MSCVEEVAKKWGLRYVVLFGSVAEGKAGPHSDVDVAVKAGRDLNLLERAKLYVELQKCFERRLDLAFLDDWDPVLAWEALSKGKPLYCVDEREFYEDLAKALDEVADLEPLLKLFKRETERALSRVAGDVRVGGGRNNTGGVEGACGGPPGA